MRKKKKNNIYFSINKLFPIFIFIVTVLMSIGYASINSIFLEIGGDVTAKESSGIFITEVNYLSNVNADLSASKINSAYQTNLNSHIVLSNTNSNSSITYQITILNKKDVDYAFDKVKFLVGKETYDNEGITFKLNGLERGDVLESNESITFTITFYYKDNVVSNNNILNSLLNFKFEYVTSPVLASNMVPVIYKDNSWKKVDEDSGEWHSYLNGKWANAITYNHNLVYNKVTNGDELKKFNGTSDYVMLGSEGYDFGKNITVVARVKLADLASSTYAIVGNQEAAGFYMSKRSKNNLSFYIYGTDSYKAVHSDFVAEAGVWYTVVGTYDGEIIKLYIDGVLNGSLEYSGSIPVSEAPIVIGGNPKADGTMATTEYFKGTISDVIVMTDTLSDAEIAQDYGKNIYHNPTKHNVLYYTKFDGGNGYVHNSATYVDEGILFDGVDDYVSIGYSMYDFQNSFTVATRVKILGKSNETTTIVGNQQQAGFSLFKTAGNKFKISAYDANIKDYQEVICDFEVELNTWYVVLSTYDGNNLKLYINGDLIGTLPIVMDFKVSNAPIVIGVNPNISSNFDGEYINAIISDIMVVDEALTSDQIKANYSDDLEMIISDKTLISYDLRGYESRDDGTVVPEEMINGMFVWVPKFNAVTPTLSGKIDVELVAPSDKGHDAFSFNNADLEGFWIGKFENGADVSYKNDSLNINVSSNVVIKPNYNSLVNKNIGTNFNKISDIVTLSDIYGFNNSVDTHLIKSNEWGAVAYLAQSKYGLCSDGSCKELVSNDTEYVTGGANYLTNTSQSTTQNVYGVYDMNGGAEEFVMGNYNKTLNTLDGFNSLPDEKYANFYTSSDEYLSNKLQHGLIETDNLFNNGTNSFVTSSNGWLKRNNLFLYSSSTGEASSSVGSRTVLIVK